MEPAFKNYEEIKIRMKKMMTRKLQFKQNIKKVTEILKDLATT